MSNLIPQTLEGDFWVFAAFFAASLGWKGPSLLRELYSYVTKRKS